MAERAETIWHLDIYIYIHILILDLFEHDDVIPTGYGPILCLCLYSVGETLRLLPVRPERLFPRTPGGRLVTLSVVR